MDFYFENSALKAWTLSFFAEYIILISSSMLKLFMFKMKYVHDISVNLNDVRSLTWI